jgi:lipooligosaccharide transport system ATP-binding protein
LCEELVIMDHGRILAHGSPAALIAEHVEPEVIEIRGEDSISRFDPLNCRTERMGSSLYCYTRDPAPLLAELHDMHAQFIHRPSGLEDVFLKLTGRELRD